MRLQQMQPHDFYKEVINISHSPNHPKTPFQ